MMKTGALSMTAQTADNRGVLQAHPEQVDRGSATVIPGMVRVRLCNDGPQKTSLLLPDV